MQVKSFKVASLNIYLIFDELSCIEYLSFFRKFIEKERQKNYNISKSSLIYN